MVGSEGLGDPALNNEAQRGASGQAPAADSSRLLMKPAEAARTLRISRSKLYALIDAGEIPVIRLGPRCTRIPRAALERWVGASATYRDDTTDRGKGK